EDDLQSKIISLALQTIYRSSPPTRLRCHSRPSSVRLSLFPATRLAVPLCRSVGPNERTSDHEDCTLLRAWLRRLLGIRRRDALWHAPVQRSHATRLRRRRAFLSVIRSRPQNGLE